MAATSRLDIAGARRRAARVFAGFTSGQKTMLVLAGLAVVVGTYLFTQWSATTSWAPLYGNLAAKDAASVTDELQSRGVPYKLGAGGSSILVPAERVYQLRIDLSAEGLPSSGSAGYALLDKQGITTSEFRQRVDYQRALEGELARTIGSIEGVENASVHLVIPADDLFTEDNRKPTASVLLASASGKRISSQQARAIVHLVASSVEGLQPEDVTVADASGKILAAPGNAEGTAADSAADATRAFEAALAGSIQQMVEEVTGDGRAVVRVKAEMDYDRRSQVFERFESDKALPVNEKTTKETFKGPGGSAGNGVLGTTEQLPAAAAGATDYSREESAREYAVNKVTEKVETAGATTKRLSVAVLLDAKKKPDVAALRKLVAAAVGLDTKRGDTLEVGTMAFDDTIAKAAGQALAQGPPKGGSMFKYIQMGVLVLIALLALFIAYRSAKKSTVARQPIEIPPHLLVEAQPIARPAAEIEAKPVALPRRAPGESPLEDLIDSQPDEVAALLRNWLGDRRVR